MLTDHFHSSCFITSGKIMELLPLESIKRASIWAQAELFRSTGLEVIIHQEIEIEGRHRAIFIGAKVIEWKGEYRETPHSHTHTRMRAPNINKIAMSQWQGTEKRTHTVNFEIRKGASKKCSWFFFYYHRWLHLKNMSPQRVIVVVKLFIGWS